MGKSRRSGTRSKSNSGMLGSAFLVIFGLVWTGFIGFADYTVGGAIIKQYQSYSFVPITATVEASELKSRSTDDGAVYYADMRYTYVVGDRRYTSTVVRHQGMGNSGSRKNASVFVKERPVGSTVIAFVNPADPTQAVLERGLSGGDLFLMLFFTPFNMVSIGFICAGWDMLRSRSSPVGGFTMSDNPQGFVVEVGYRNPFTAGVVAIGIFAFLAIFAVAFGTGSGFSPSADVMLWTWTIVLSLTIASVAWTIYHNQAGLGDLEADFLKQQLIVPVSKQSMSRRIFSLQDPQAVILRTVEKSDSDSNTKSYTVEFRLRNAVEPVIVGEITMEYSAIALSEWLSQRMGLPLEAERVST